MLRDVLLRKVAVATGVREATLRSWWWSQTHQRRGEARAAMLRLLRGSGALRLTWRERKAADYVVNHAIEVGPSGGLSYLPRHMLHAPLRIVGCA